MEAAQSPIDQSSALETVRGLEQQYLLNTYARIPLLLERGKGAYVYDADGNRYLDFVSGIGVNALGYAHPRIVKVIREQSVNLIHTSNLYFHPFQAKLAQRLAQLSGMQRAFFTNSGTEAIEGALKLARLQAAAQNSGKTELIALENSFHGRTFGALSITGQEKYRRPFEPGLPGVRFVPRGSLEALTAAVGPNTCAIVLEPIQGEGGIQETDAAYLAGARRLADQHGAVLIFDEIQCGLGRTGKPFAFQWTSVSPDVVVIAKPLAAGLPLGCILARGEVANRFTAGLHGTTFGGGPLACRVALEFLDILDDERLLDHIQTVGGELKQGLAGLRKTHSCVTEVRGRGLMLAMELDHPAKAAVDAARARGLLVNATHDTVVRLLPPYIVQKADVKKALKILGEVLQEVSRA